MNNKRKTIIILAFIAVLCTIGIGYAFLEAKLSITSGVKVAKHCNDNGTLYGKIMCEASDPDGKVLKQINEDAENDNIDDSQTEKKSISYYSGEVTNNNVMFAGLCWKAIRTTETNGVKLIYNGHITSDNKCSNTETYILPSTAQYNTISKSLSNVGYMTNISYEIKNKQFTAEEMVEANQILFGKKVTFDTDNNLYTINSAEEPANPEDPVDPSLSSNVNFYDWANYTNELNNYHYTCLDATDNCETVKYLIKVDVENTTIYYVELTGGKTIETAIADMLTAAEVNTTASPIKTMLEDWYENNLGPFDEFIEETSYCNDRRISDLAGWSPTGNVLEDLKFYGMTTKDLTCKTATDRFTTRTADGNAKNAKKIGLLTAGEATLISKSALNSGSEYWLMTPAGMEKDGAKAFYIDENGAIASALVDQNIGIRPVISLTKDTKVLSTGDGSLDSPFIVDTTGA